MLGELQEETNAKIMYYLRMTIVEIITKGVNKTYYPLF